MCGIAKYGFCSFHQGLRQRWMCVNRIGQIPRGYSISMASTASAIISPAPAPTMPMPRILCLTGSMMIFVRPSVLARV